jgi:hypothetical protein
MRLRTVKNMERDLKELMEVKGKLASQGLSSVEIERHAAVMDLKNMLRVWNECLFVKSRLPVPFDSSDWYRCMDESKKLAGEHLELVMAVPFPLQVVKTPAALVIDNVLTILEENNRVTLEKVSEAVARLQKKNGGTVEKDIDEAVTRPKEKKSYKLPDKRTKPGRPKKRTVRETPEKKPSTKRIRRTSL